MRAGTGTATVGPRVNIGFLGIVYLVVGAIAAVKHTDTARGRTRRALGLSGTLRRLATDETLRSELRGARNDLRRAYGRLEKKNRSHRLRNVTLVAALASLAAAPVRKRLTARPRTQ